MYRLMIVVLIALALAGCEGDYFATLTPEGSPAATAWPSNTPVNTALPPDATPTQEATEFPYYRRDCVPDAININACMVQEPGSSEPYDAVIEIRPMADDWPDEKTARVTWLNGLMVYDVTGLDGGFTGDIVLIFDRSENAPQFEYEPGDCLAVNVSLTSNFGGVPVRRFVGDVNLGAEAQLWMWLTIVLDNGEVIEHGREWDFSDHVEPSPSVNGHREFYWVFWSLDPARAIEEFELGYHQNSPITGAGNDLTFDWVKLHTISKNQCGNAGPLW